MLAYFDRHVGWGELLRRTVTETIADNGFGLAAQLAYYFFLALFPALIFVIALVSILPAGENVQGVLSTLGQSAPPAVLDIVREQLAGLRDSRQGGTLMFGVAAALWSSSAAMVAIIDALNRAYDVSDVRSWWRRHLTAVLLTIGAAAFILCAFALVVAGPQVAAYVARQAGVGDVFQRSWLILQWPLVFCLATLAFGLIYYFAPDVDQDFAYLTPGALVATSLWLAGSLAFRAYVTNFGSYNQMYGTIGGVIVMLLWLYLTGFVIIVGAEMNAEIEHASPHGRAAGGVPEPGRRKAVGARAARQFHEARERARRAS